MAQGLRWTSELPARFPHRTGSASQAEDAVAVYRRALAGEPDTSVVVVTVGFFTNLRDLLLSGPDSLSELTGRELVERKVKRLVSMAGHFPEGLEFNVMMDAPAAAYVMEHWPSPVILSGFEIGEKIITGRRTAAEGPADSPVAEAYRMSLPQDNPGRPQQLGPVGRAWWPSGDRTRDSARARHADGRSFGQHGPLDARPSGPSCPG